MPGNRSRRSQTRRNRNTNRRRGGGEARTPSPPSNTVMLQEEIRNGMAERGEKWECPVCMEDFEAADIVFAPCSHKLCATCFNDSRIDKCPVCRETLGKPVVAPVWESESSEEEEFEEGTLPAHLVAAIRGMMDDSGPNPFGREIGGILGAVSGSGARL